MISQDHTRAFRSGAAYWWVCWYGTNRNGAREAMLSTEFKLHLLEQGINVIKTFLLTLEHTEKDIDNLIVAIVESLRRLREDGLL